MPTNSGMIGQSILLHSFASFLMDRSSSSSVLMDRPLFQIEVMEEL
jgi:hypothetical protein